MMAVSSAMDMQGAVSRAVEGAIVEIAQEVMKEGQAVLRHFGFSDQNARSGIDLRRRDRCAD